MKLLSELLAEVPQRGRVRWIGVRPSRHADMLELEAVEARREAGLTGDHTRPSPRNARQVTLIQWEHLAVVGALLGRPIAPEDLRRNIAISGINLLSLKGRRFQIGQALLETTGCCQPCVRLEQRLGRGTFQALRGHGGITARVPGRVHSKGRTALRSPIAPGKARDAGDGYSLGKSRNAAWRDGGGNPKGRDQKIAVRCYSSFIWNHQTSLLMPCPAIFWSPARPSFTVNTPYKAALFI